MVTRITYVNKETKQVKFNSIIKQVENLFKNLTKTENKTYIFIDELELTLGHEKNYQKDIRLIRDLVIAVNRINTICLQKGYPISFITAIRSEVLTSLNASGKEINKIITDFGITLNWHQAGSSSNQQPLIKIINKKIQVSEEALDLEVTENIEKLWEKYFTQKISSKTPQEYILHSSWYRPRDIVRLLLIAQEQFPNSEKFSSTVFDGIRKEYSMKSWVEHTEELRAKYTPEEIDGIQKILLGISCPFSLFDITAECDKKKITYTSVNILLQKHKLGDILSILYKVGIIGNSGEKVRYSFRGDDDILLDKPMKIHDSLWNYLSISFKDQN